MLSSQSLQYSPLPTNASDLDEEKGSSEIVIHSFNIDSSQGKNDIEDLIKALVKGEGKTYFEKIKLAFKSSFLFLPILFVNGSIIFFDSQERLEASMRKNIYYDHFFHKLIKTFSYEAGIVSAEAAAITTPSVLLTHLITVSSLVYQGVKYLLNKKEMNKLVAFLEKKQYANAAKLLSYSLSQQQINEIRDLLETNQLDKSTTIKTELSGLEKFTSDMLWFQDESHKYISPLLFLSLLPGFFLMFSVAKDIDEEMQCSMFALWGLLLNVCPTIQKAELMSLLTYMWGCFSGTYLLTHSFALVSRLVMSPFPSARQKFNEKINEPFSNWWGNDQHYEKLITKSLLATVMPAIAAYSLYSSIQFTNAYLNITGCSDISKALDKFFSSSSKPYPCSTTQAALGASVFVGEFEFNHLYPAYIAIESLGMASAFIVKRIPYFKQERIIQKVKGLLDHFTPLENKMTIAIAAGGLLGGLAGVWPSLQMANTILQKEGFELFFPLNNLPLPTNVTYPDFPPNQPFPLDEILKNTPACTINADIGVPDIHFGNTTISGFNTSLPCVETFYDEASNTTIMGLQVTAPCPNQNIYSTFYRNLLHLPISCDPILVVRAFAGFVVPYWLSVNSGAALSTTLAAAVLLSVWALQTRRTPSLQLAQVPANDGRTSRGSYSPRLFSNASERTSLKQDSFSPNLPLLEEVFDDELDNDLNDDAYLNRLQPTCWTRLRNRLARFFSCPQEPAVRESGSSRPLLGVTRSNLNRV